MENLVLHSHHSVPIKIDSLIINSIKSLPKSNAKYTPTAQIKFVQPLDHNPISEEGVPYLHLSKTHKISNSFRIVTFDAEGSMAQALIGLADLTMAVTHLKNFKKLEIDVPADPLVSALAMKRILEGVACLPFLETLIMRFSDIHSSHEMGFKALTNVFEKCISLRELNLKFSSCEKIFTHANAAIFEQSMHKRGIESVTLDISQTDTLESSFISMFLSSVTKMGSLSKLVIKLHACPLLSDTAFADFAKATEMIKSVVALDFGISYCPMITSKGIQYLAQAIAPMRSLTQLKLSFCGMSSLDDECMTKFAHNFKKLLKVSVFGLDLTDCVNVNVHGFFALRDLLTNFDELKKVSLRIAHMFLSLHSMTAIYGALSVYHQMTELNFDLSYSPHIGEKALLILRDTLANMKKLKSLKITLDGWVEILSEKNTPLLRDCIANLKNLRTLELSLVGCNRISDKGFEVFRDMFDLMSGLKSLKLNFRDCKDISLIGWDHIIKGLLKLSELIRLVIDVTHCEKLVENFCTGVVSVVQHNKLLEHFEVHACGTNEMTDRGVSYLKEAVLFASKLKTVKLSYSEFKTSVYRVDKLKATLEKKLKLFGSSITISGTPPLI